MNATIPLLLFGLGTAISIMNRKAGYASVAASSLVYLVMSVMDYSSVLDLFPIIASTVWFLMSLFSIGYDGYGRWLAPLFSLSVFGMVLVLTSTNYLEFLAGWEVMTVPVYVALGLRKGHGPAFTFMAFGELSTALLLAGFITSGNLEFAELHSAVPLMIATLGFMVKMGVLPFMASEWLPISQGSAPSNLSALISASMTLMGVYGILKMASLTAVQIPLAFSLAILVLGSAGVFFGALYGYVSEHLNGVLAFSTAENNGAILAGIALYMAFRGEEFLLAPIILAFAHSLAKTGLFLSVGLQEAESMSLAKKLRGQELGLALLAASMSGLLPTLGGVGSWLLFENLFISAYLLHSVVSTVIIASGFAVAMGEGLATALNVRFINYTSVFKKNNDKISMIELLPILLSGALVLVLGFTVVYSVYPSKASIPLLGMLLDSVMLTQYNGNGFGGIDPLYVAVLVQVLSLVSLLAFGKPKTRRVRTWNSGVRDQEEYAAFAMANNIRLMLRKVLGYKAGQLYVVDVFWAFMHRVAVGLSKFGRAFGSWLINSSISWYVIYIMVVLILVLVLI